MFTKTERSRSTPQKLNSIARREKVLRDLATSLEGGGDTNVSLTPVQKRMAIRNLKRTLQAVQSAVPGYDSYLKEGRRPTIAERFRSFLSTDEKTLAASNIDYTKITFLIQEIIDEAKVYRNEYRKAQTELALGVPQHSAFGRQLSAEATAVVKETKLVSTGVTLDYQKKKWGLQRILLDGIQNHLPADSGGRATIIQFFDQQTNSWIPWEVGKNVKARRITKIRFSDDGNGFDPKLLVYMKSTKDEDVKSAGQFGEGIKMISAAAVRNNLAVEFESRDWRARPVSREETFVNATQRDEAMKVLCFEIDTLKREKPFVGSCTTFSAPAPEFVSLVQKIDERVLHFRKGYEPLCKGPAGEVVSIHNSDLYLKGILVTPQSSQTLLSYNFYNAEPNRDRDSLNSKEVDEMVRNILSHADNAVVIETLLKEIIERSDAGGNKAETSSSFDPKHPQVWKKVFHALYGEKAVISHFLSKEGSDPVVKRRGYNVVQVKSYALALTLGRAGIPDINEILYNLGDEEISSSLTLEATERWDENRILLDIVQNHLPHDARGSHTEILVQLKGDSRWVPLHGLSQGESARVGAIRIVDDGGGYDVQNLGLINSSKVSQAQSAGQFGEGLKMAAAAALRLGMKVEFASRDWKAGAKAKEIEVDGRKVKKLVFEVSLVKKDTDATKGSQSTIANITPAMQTVLSDVPNRVLYFNTGKKVLSTSRAGVEALDIARHGRVFNKGLFITDEYASLLVASYNLAYEDLPRDRDTLKSQVMRDNIRSVLKETSNPEYVDKVIDAAARSDKEFLEFQDLAPDHKSVWRDTFLKRNGDKALVVDVPLGASEIVEIVRARGYNPVYINKEVGSTLKKCGVRGVMEVYKEWYAKLEFVNERRLDPSEQATFNFRHKVDPYLPGNKDIPVKIFETDDKDLVGGFYDGKIVAVNRKKLKDLKDFIDVYVHEKAHQITGAMDETREHFTYVSRAFADLLLKVIPR